jgi:hypothetical protein
MNVGARVRGDTMDTSSRDTRIRPLLLGGVVGGVGVSTFARVLHAAVTVAVHDMGRYEGVGPLDLLVTSNTAASTTMLGRLLGLCPRPPVLIVMHTVAGGINRASRAHLRAAEPHVCTVLEVLHQRSWPGLAAPPGLLVPKRVLAVARELPAAVQRMYADTAPRRPVRTVATRPDPGGPGAETAPVAEGADREPVWARVRGDVLGGK